MADWKPDGAEIDAMAGAITGAPFVIPPGLPISDEDDARLKSAYVAGRTQQNRRACPYMGGLLRGYWMMGNERSDS